MPDLYLSDLPADLYTRAARVRLLGLDVDGTLSDGRLWFTASGEEMKAFHVLDGQGIKLMREIGVAVAFISARQSPLVERRARELGVVHLIQGCHDKRRALDDLCAQLDIRLSEVAYMGDDLPDLPVLAVVGLAAAPPNAHPWVEARVHWRTGRAGGEGAVRELCDLLLLAQGHDDTVLARFLPP